MPLEFQNLEVRLGALNTDADPSSLPPGSLTVCSNVSSEEPGVYVKRFGYSAVSLPASPLPSVRRLVAREDELGAVDNAAAFWSMSPVGVTYGWFKRLEPVPWPTVSAKSIYVERSTSSPPHEPTVAYANGVALHAFLSVQAGVMCAVVSVENVATGTFVVENLSVGSADVSYTQIRAVAADNRIVVIYSSSASQRVDGFSFDTTTMTGGGLVAIYNGANVSATVASLDR